jgi:hypothetical protein
MSWLLFLDESGHDHKNTPYEVHGGIAIHATKLWRFISAIHNLEQSLFGTNLSAFKHEIKGSKLLKKKVFKLAQQDNLMDELSRRKHALKFLNDGAQQRTPSRESFTAYGQACITLAEELISLLQSHDAKLFASVVPKQAKPQTAPTEYLRKDMVFLLERYFYFLESKQEMGLLVMDGTEKQADTKTVRSMENYFKKTFTGRQRTQWIVPAPLFVESDMVYGVQVADLCIYCLNWAWRLKEMTEPTRQEIEPFVSLLKKIIWHGDGYRDGNQFYTHGTCYIPDLYETR